MSDAPHHAIDPAAFAADPYPDLARMRAGTPIAHVPQLGATLLTLRDDIWTQEKRIEVFSSHQPQGLMTRLMGENMMRKDGAAHMAERRALFPALSPRIVRDLWRPQFMKACARVLDALEPKGAGDLVRDFALPVSGAALCAMTGLTTMTPQEMDAVSQAMIDGCANYSGDPAVEARCHDATARIDRHIDLALANPGALPTCIAVQRAAALPEDSLRANVKLVISGGQNEPRDAIAGTAWALLAHPDARADVAQGRASWAQAFDEYARLIAPIGMSPRQVARPAQVRGVSFDPGDRVFLMFSSANRDARHFARADEFDIHRNTGPALTFGAGPHFCAGAAAARCLITEVALPQLFARLPRLRLAGAVRFHGWAFRGPVAVPVRWD